MEIDSSSRADGRHPLQLRSTKCEIGVLHRAHGSARWSQGGTSALAAVYILKASDAGRTSASAAVLDVNVKGDGSLSKAEEMHHARVLHETLKSIVMLARYPRTCVQITINVLRCDGAVAATSMNAACAALLDAGLAMRGVPTACTAACDASTTVIIDPDAIETTECSACCTAVFLHAGVGGNASKAAELAGCIECGGVAMPQMLTLVDACKKGCIKVAQLMHGSLERRMLELTRP